VTVAVTGPLGAPAEHFAQFDHIVLVSGGIGATPMNSICADLMLKRKEYGTEKPFKPENRTNS
jgi:ferredoxin-NADP reductase